MKILLDLLFTFMKIGAFTFGGGYAMIPLIQRETVENKKWVTNEDIMDIVVIAESTPGPIAINASTFVGYKTAGFKGALCATIGMILPSFIIIVLISFLLDQFQNLKAVQYAFFGVRACVLALILNSFFNMAKQLKKKQGIIIAATAFVLAAVLRINVLLATILCAIIGLVSALIAERRMRK